ncbi:hypothetical protein [Massilia sp. DWR3-1-1]|uniref:hypothetical protein n=1 Tax=Massilia sp. DWR3-1-1 TaxID=2804559 RepID=UPI003CF8ACA8
MYHSFESITSTATGAIRAIGDEAQDSEDCDRIALRAVGVGVQFLWEQLVGKSASTEEIEEMITLIRRIPVSDRIDIGPGSSSGDAPAAP